eukprot:38274_1
MGNKNSKKSKKQESVDPIPSTKQDDIDPFSETVLQSTCDQLCNCFAVKRLSTILLEFHRFKNNPDSCNFKSMCEYIEGLGNTYNNSALLNDYIHLLNEHNSNEDFEYVYKCFISEMTDICDVMTCNFFCRYQRDRSRDYEANVRDQLYNTSDTKEITTQQIIDKIHCYWLHTFDLGYKLTSKELQEISTNDEQKTENKNNISDNIRLTNCIDNELIYRQKIIRNKRTRFTETENKQQIVIDDRNRNNKWIIKKDAKSHRTNDAKLGQIYSFGFPYKYGKYHRKHKWYICKKYTDFKIEITTNTTHHLSMVEYNDWYEKAEGYFNSYYCKQMPAYMGDAITIEQLLAVMIYCGADELQRTLTETYRKNGDTESDKNLKIRHSEFSNWGSLLLNTINYFGKEVNKSGIKTFYHGIDHEMTFQSTVAFFNGPLSTSSEYQVALVFATRTNSSGLIIELEHLDGSHACFFDCAWLSEYPYESEKLFIGGDFGLIIKNIVEPLSGENYGIFIEGLNIIQQMMRGNPYKYTKGKPIPRHVKKCVTKLLRHELYKQSEIEQEEQKENRTRNYKIYCDLPIYIDKSLHYYCSNVIEISIDWRTLNQRNENKPDKGYRFTRDIFVLTEFNESFLDLRAFSLLFPNMYTITITNLRLTRSAMDAMTCYCQQLQLSNSRNPKLNEIIVYRPIKVTDDHEKKPGKEITTSGIDMAVNEYANVFNQYGWQLTKKARFELQITKIKRQ